MEAESDCQVQFRAETECVSLVRALLLNLYKATSRINCFSISCARASTVASEVLTEAQSFCWLQIKHPNRLLASALSNFLNVFLPGLST